MSFSPAKCILYDLFYQQKSKNHRKWLIFEYNSPLIENIDIIFFTNINFKNIIHFINYNSNTINHKLPNINITNHSIILRGTILNTLLSGVYITTNCNHIDNHTDSPNLLVISRVLFAALANPLPVEPLFY